MKNFLSCFPVVLFGVNLDCACDHLDIFLLLAQEPHEPGNLATILSGFHLIFFLFTPGFISFNREQVELRSMYGVAIFYKINI